MTTAAERLLAAARHDSTGVRGKNEMNQSTKLINECIYEVWTSTKLLYYYHTTTNHYYYTYAIFSHIHIMNRENGGVFSWLFYHPRRFHWNFPTNKRLEWNLNFSRFLFRLWVSRAHIFILSLTLINVL